ncbi:preprotein translocase subunit SecY [Blochmannia endosymbiont of Polyrhachis (Hedomyrma) turneri]|uniref:preprotein translocase subunit SecY n=1 Tax=Blochmannia endosymbiont of Polyrhachis (Hedomyrma) turneri TaxID=1505596 RepID=UPI00061A5C57|nr:preprotein translocase subunit SecY [Blochmannia endosymbiont of Polyrhachis (Hedomyrma) turneri]AKC59788.1 Protein translocase subunit SecY [Blochmannia endosymbiont of Polyrhachis (Hedomyrma) turneri]
MIKTSKLCYENIKGGFYTLRRRLFFVVGALIIFRIGSFIPIPGIDIRVFTKILEQQQGTIIEMFNMFSGGALSRASVFSLGIMPYISSSIIVQLLSSVHPKLIELKKEGEAGRRKINSFIRYGTLFLGIFQAIGIATGLLSISGIHHGLIVNPCISFYFIVVTSLVCGTIFLMWLGEQITHRGIGNGISIIIFSGIVAELPVAVLHTIEHARQGELHFFVLILVSILILLITFFVVFIERGQRCIIVHYAKKQHGRKIYTPQSTHLPLKVNMAGVIPAIFASSVILFPGTITSWFGDGIGWNWLTVISFYLQPGQFLYIILYAVAIIFFCFFYTSLVFNARETSENLKKSGAFVPGIRPGEQTARYINKVMVRLTLFGAVYITFICLVPELLRVTMHVPFYFGGTSLLIVVIVIMDFIVQVQTLLMSTQYESVLKKTHLKGF